MLINPNLTSKVSKFRVQQRLRFLEINYFPFTESHLLSYVFLNLFSTNPILLLRLLTKKPVRVLSTQELKKKKKLIKGTT